MEASTSAAAAAEAAVRKYDAECKRVLSEKQYLSRIMCEVLEEYRGLTPREVEETCFVGEPLLDDPVGRDDRAAGRIRQLRGEDATVGENVTTFDIRFEARVPGTEGEVLIDVNVEAQRRLRPGYPLMRRAVYYCGRLLSMQGEELVVNSHYERVRKVVSIWVCTECDRQSRGTITRFRLGREDLVGHGGFDRADWDLVEVVMICLDNRDPEGAKGVLGMLGTLLVGESGAEEKKRRLSEKYGIIMSEDIEEGVESMCNLGEGVLERGYIRGIEQGTRENLIENLRSLMETLQVDAERAMDLLRVEPAERQAIAALL